MDEWAEDDEEALFAEDQAIMAAEQEAKTEEVKLVEASEAEMEF